jgi:hypothetical protein
VVRPEKAAVSYGAVMMVVEEVQVDLMAVMVVGV